MVTISASEGRTAPPVGYSLILPSEWARIPLRSGTDEAIRRTLDAAVGRLAAGAPREKLVPLRREAEKRLRASVQAAQRGNGLDLYFPSQPIGGKVLAASFVVSEMELPGERPSDPQLIALELTSGEDPAASEETAGTGEVAGALAVRRERVLPADPASGVDNATRRVDYYIAVPGDPRRWMGVSFSASGTGNPRDRVADALVQWFDALMENFAWKEGAA